MSQILNKFTIQSSFAISAGAGSGKTYTLSRRYINAVLGFDFFIEKKDQDNFVEYKEKNSADVSQIVTITYTEAAALEMKERIFDLMEKVIIFYSDELKADDGDHGSIKMGMDKLDETQKEYVVNTLKNALYNSNNAFISTIHSFCLNTIESNSDLAKLDSRLSIIQDDEKQKILDEVRLETLGKKEKDTFKVFKQTNKFKVNQIIEKYATNAKFRESLDRFIEKPLITDIYKQMIYELFPLPDISDIVYEELDEKRRVWLSEYVKNFKEFNAKAWSKLKAEELPSVKAPTLGKKYPFTVSLKDTYENLTSVYSQIDDTKEESFNKHLRDLHKLLQDIHHAYKQTLQEENKIDFDAIIATTATIIGKTTNDYKYIMVDEFQDTNSLQNEIVNIIAKDRNLFVVGDSKQSIYSFQGAELEVFNNAVDRLTKVPMSINFRSDKKILSYVNDVFKVLFEQDGDRNNLISSNYKASFTKDDELQPSSQDKDDGDVEFLVLQEDGYQENGNQFANMAKFIKAIKDNEIKGYEKIRSKIAKKEKAIGVLFDSSTHMLKLKKELDHLGVEAKVSATENFYHTREINDIFLVLKSIEILRRKTDKKLSRSERYYIAGALRSNILRYDEKQIIELFKETIDELIKVFEKFIGISKILKISSLIKYMVDNTKLFDIYTYLGDIEQRAANIEKLIMLAIEFESNNSNDLYRFLEDLQRNIYFNKDTKEDEAFYKSDNLESVELCTIHSTKGLAYPMVILAQSEKPLHSNATGERGLSFSTFTLNQDSGNEDYSAVGFKVDEYEPLIYRLLKQISKNKHEAEKKRLLYVALTRAEHNLVIAGSVYRKTPSNAYPKGEVGLTENSYLSWLSTKSLKVEKEVLICNDKNEKVKFVDTDKLEKITGCVIDPDSFEIAEYQEQRVEFKENKKRIASDNKEHTINANITAQAKIGTAIHSIIERYWENFDDESLFENICFKYKIFDESSKLKIKRYIDNFKTTITYEKLRSGAIHYFEKEFNMFDGENHTQGIIDFLYFDEELKGWVVVDFKSNNVQGKNDLMEFAKDQGYDQQLETYKNLAECKGLSVVGKKLLFLDNGMEVEI